MEVQPDKDEPTEPFQHAIELFNQQEFFACHDVLEEIWNETINDRRDFYQGLIHVAVSLFHFGEGNFGGARKMHDSALKYLLAYGEAYHGVDLHRLRTEFTTCFGPLLGEHRDYPKGVTMDPSLVPKIHLIDLE